jgi:hypothetical protein
VTAKARGLCLRASTVLLRASTVLALVASAGVAHGATTVTATVDRDGFDVGERALLMIIASGDAVGNVQPPPAPSIDGLRISGPVGPSRSQQIQVVNGTVTRHITVSYTYSVDGRKPCEAVVPAMPVTIDGKKTYMTSPIRLSVGRGRTPGQDEAQPLSMRVKLSSTSAYPGQAVTVEYVLRELVTARVGSRQIAVHPEFTGAWVETLFDAREDQAPRTRDASTGVAYDVMPIAKFVLFPTGAGTVTIPSMAISGSVAMATGRRDFWGQLVYRHRTETAHSREYALRIAPLPPDPPPGFAGAVGSFGLASRVDRTEVDQGDPVTWTVTLAGQGNIKAIGDVLVPDLSGFQDYEPQVTTTIDKSGMSYGGRKVYERVLIPLHSGAVAIPGASFVYFDPTAALYRTATTPPTMLTVAPRGDDSPGGPASALTPTQIRQVGSDIRFIMPDATVLSDQRQGVWGVGWYRYAFLLPLALVVAAAGVRLRRLRLGSDPGRVRSMAARSEGRKRLQRAQALIGSEDYLEAVGAVGDAVSELVAAQSGRTVAGLTSDGIAEALAAHDTPEQIVDRVVALLQRCDRARYAPSSIETAEAALILDEGQDLVASLIRYMPV